MARFRNRIVKAEFWSDGELRRWSRDKRIMYLGLWSIAEDSGCLEDDPLEWLAQIFSSPLDRDITLEQMTAWRDELLAAGKLIPYTVDGKRCVYLRTFPKHENPRNPQSPGVPLPPWVVHEVEGEGRGRRVKYTHHDWHPFVENASGDRSTTVQSAPGDRNTSPALPSPALSCPEPLSSTTDAADEADKSDQQRPPSDDFDDFWSAYPRKEAKKPARTSWLKLSASDRAAAIAAAVRMGDCVSQGWKERTYCPMPTTFLNQRRWEDWAEGTPAGYAPPKGSGATSADDDHTPACSACGRRLTPDEQLDAVYDDSRGWRHPTCPRQGDDDREHRDEPVRLGDFVKNLVPDSEDGAT